MPLFLTIGLGLPWFELFGVPVSDFLIRVELLQVNVFYFASKTEFCTSS